MNNNKELHDNNSNVNVQMDKNPTFKGGSDIPVAWWYTVNVVNRLFSEVEPPDDAYDEGTLTPLYTSPHHDSDVKQYRELSDDEILKLWDADCTNVFANYLIDFAKAILERAKK